MGIQVGKTKSRLFFLVFGSFLFLSLIDCHKKVTAPNSTGGNYNASYSTSDDRLLVGTCYYPWYDNATWISSCLRGKLIPQQLPYLGVYDCSTPTNISQHVKWSVESKINFWISSWWGPYSGTDKIIIGHHLNNADFLKQMSYCLLYETTGRLGELPIQVNDDKISRFLDDLKYLIEYHFNRSNYMKIDGQPVLYMYLTRTLNGNYRKLFSDADSLLIQNGYKGLFVVGDEVYWNSPDESRAKYMNAISCYNPHTSVDWVTDAERFVVRAGSEMYVPWMNKANKLGIGLWVDAIPGFNDLGVRKEAQHPVIERKNGEIFDQMLRMAGSVLTKQTVPLKVLVVTSFNEWFEDTQIEPTVVTSQMTYDPVEYTDGYGYIGYGTKYLDAVKNFAQSFGN
jgi:glycoprotein endo-alpha-1,2-mannosidase